VKRGSELQIKIKSRKNPKTHHEIHPAKKPAGECFKKKKKKKKFEEKRTPHSSKWEKNGQEKVLPKNPSAEGYSDRCDLMEARLKKKKKKKEGRPGGKMQ